MRHYRETPPDFNWLRSWVRKALRRIQPTPLLYVAAAKVTDGAPDKSKFAAMAKRLATDTGSSVVDRALQLHGGYGYLQDYPIERFWRDLRVHSILEGTNQVMRMIVGRELTRQ